MNEPSISTQLGDALVEIAQAKECLEKRRKFAYAARREETDAFNRLNNAQKAFDAIVARLRSDAPRDSDWGRPQGGNEK